MEKKAKQCIIWYGANLLSCLFNCAEEEKTYFWGSVQQYYYQGRMHLWILVHVHFLGLCKNNFFLKIYISAIYSRTLCKFLLCGTHYSSFNEDAEARCLKKRKFLWVFSKTGVVLIVLHWRLMSNNTKHRVTLTTTQYMRKLMLELMRRRRWEMDSE